VTYLTTSTPARPITGAPSQAQPGSTSPATGRAAAKGISAAMSAGINYAENIPCGSSSDLRTSSTLS
jgi:hypothetical protein